MNKKRTLLTMAAVMMVALTTLAACKQNAKTNHVVDEEEAVEQVDDLDATAKTVKVDNALDLIQALGNNRRIIITTTRALNITEALDQLIDDGEIKNYMKNGEPRTEPGIYFEVEYDGNVLVVAGMSNITIEGKDEAHLQVTPRYADVIRFQNCNNINIDDIVMGHTDTGDCVGDVLGFYDCNNIKIEDCGLYGCGVNGVHAERCSNISLEDSHIYECDQFAVLFNGVSNATFSECSIYNNGCGLRIDEDCSNIVFNKCEITNNRGTLFFCDSKVTIKKSKVEHHYDDITGNINFVDCDVVMDYNEAEVYPDIEPDDE